MFMSKSKQGVVLVLIGIVCGGCLATWYFYSVPSVRHNEYGSETPNRTPEKTGTPQPQHGPRRWPEIQLPVVTDLLQKSPFDKNWKENPDLATMRKFGVVENIPDEEVLKTYNVKTLSALYHSYLDNSNIRCHRKLRMGNVGDGGWEICDDYEWRPIPPCVIYSFGINYDFSFDDDAGRIYGCDVYAFDPSMVNQPTYRRSGRVMFYRLGIGGHSGTAKKPKKKNGWVLHSLSNIRTMLNHSKTVIDVLKMDVESAEWDSVVTMIKEGQLGSVRQLLIEFHQSNDDVNVLRTHLKLLGDIEREGFRKFYVSKNFHCLRNALAMPIKRTSCYEIHYVNSNFRREQ